MTFWNLDERSAIARPRTDWKKSIMELFYGETFKILFPVEHSSATSSYVLRYSIFAPEFGITIVLYKGTRELFNGAIFAL